MLCRISFRIENYPVIFLNNFTIKKKLIGLNDPCSASLGVQVQTVNKATFSMP